MTREPSNVFRSECGVYLCRFLGSCNFEAWTADGETHWANDDRPEREYTLPLVVGGYSAEMIGQKKNSFTLYLLRCDPTIKIIPFRGNTVIESLHIVFRRRVPWMHVPRWMRGVA